MQINGWYSALLIRHLGLFQLDFSASIRNFRERMMNDSSSSGLPEPTSNFFNDRFKRLYRRLYRKTMNHYPLDYPIREI